jgi:HEAT repeat protein
MAGVGFILILHPYYRLLGQESFPSQLISFDKKLRDGAHKRLKTMHFGEKKQLAQQILPGLKNEDYRVCNLTCYTLGQMGPAAYEAVPMLIDVLKNRSDCPNVLYAIKHIGRPAIPALIEMIKKENDKSRGISSKALIKMGYASREAIPALKEILAQSDEFYGIEYAPLVAQIDPAEVVPFLARLVAHGEYPIRKDAAALLAEMGPDAKEAIPNLIDSLKEKSYFKSEDWRAESARALGNMGPDAKEAVPQIAKLLADEDQAIRREALKALQKIGTRDARKAIKKYMGGT